MAVYPNSPFSASAHPTLPQAQLDGAAISSSLSKQARSTAFEPTTVQSNEADSVSRHITHNTINGDVEGQQSSSFTRENDPYNLSESLKTDIELQSMRADISRKRDGFGPITLNKESTQARKVQKFYEEQNENIHRFLKPVHEHIRTAKEVEEANQLKLKIAVTGSFVANLCLAVIQVYGALTSHSLSLFATTADAVFDPCSNITLMLSARAVKKVDPHEYPSGKARWETAGNIIFCFLMTFVSVILIIFSGMEIAEGSETKTKDFHYPSVIAIGIAFLTKLALFLYCGTLRKVYSQVLILWKDHRNDVIINLVGMLTSILGSQVRWWIDPMGAIILAVFLIWSWLRTAKSEFEFLVGKTADTWMLQWITYICMLTRPSPWHLTNFL